MASHVEVGTLIIFRASEPADLVPLPENSWLNVELGQLIGRGQPRRPGPDDDDLLPRRALVTHQLPFPRQLRPHDCGALWCTAAQPALNRLDPQRLRWGYPGGHWIS